MFTIFADRALLSDGWASNIRVVVGADGRIAQVTRGERQAGEARADILLPASVNLHSHAFQRAMAGLTEHRGPDPRDTFWTWRQLMFRFLDRLTPDDIEAIAAFVQMEMLKAGYAAVCEFHYLHHRPGGAPYLNRAETGARIAAAAARTGIGLTHLPVLYMHGGCDGRPLSPGQIRFGCDLNDFSLLLDASREALRDLPADTVMGVAPHSLRAVTRDALAEIPRLTDGPIHMHLAEQVAEVDEVQSHWGARPTDWLLANAPVDPRWCLIHCTQMERRETLALAASGAVAGLCPITEANLGDGIFDGVAYLEAQGRIGIGSDSNIRIALSEELRQLDHSQRLRDRSRAALATATKSTGRRLYDAILQGGAQAAGRASGAIAPGLWADLVALDGDATDLIGRKGDRILDSWVFAADDRLVRDVWSAGRHAVRDGTHPDRTAITDAYRATIRRLEDAL